MFYKSKVNNKLISTRTLTIFMKPTLHIIYILTITLQAFRNENQEHDVIKPIPLI